MAQLCNQASVTNTGCCSYQVHSAVASSFPGLDPKNFSNRPLSHSFLLWR